MPLVYCNQLVIRLRYGSILQYPSAGYVDNKTEIARFSEKGTVEERSGGALSDMYIIVRELKGGPPNCE